MPSARGARHDLSAAHKGYAYQDLATAFALALSLVESTASVTVDRKLVAGDRFDDLSVRDGRGFVRRQIKWSEPGFRTLGVADFARGQSALRIDELVLSYIRMVPRPADEYRLCVAWGRLRWIDDVGHDAFVYRTWRLRALGMDRASELPLLQGCEVLARPDIVAALTTQAGVRLRAITHIQRTVIPTRDDSDD